MKNLSYLVVILASVAITTVLAITASFLPSGKTKNTNTDQNLNVLYPNTINSLIPNEEITDLLSFKLRPAQITPQAKKVARVLPSLFDTIDTNTTLAQEDITSLGISESIEKFILSSENSNKIILSIAKINQDRFTFREKAIRETNLEDCENIDNKKMAENCRNEVNFQKAILMGNLSLCEKVTNKKLRNRCKRNF